MTGTPEPEQRHRRIDVQRRASAGEELHAIQPERVRAPCAARAVRASAYCNASHGARSGAERLGRHVLAADVKRPRHELGRAAPPARSAWPLTPASTRSKMRGTAVISAGRTSRRSRKQLVGIVADEVARPLRAGRYRSTCARKCASTEAPRSRRARLRCPRIRTRARLAASKARLSCESMTPFGVPVVPDV